jgi:cytochrome c556
MVSAGSSVAAPAAGLSKAEAEGIVYERQQIMTQLGKDAEVLGDIGAGTAPKEKLAATAKSIAQGAKDSVAAFQQQVPGGRSKAEVWANYAQFMQRMQAFANNADRMAKVAETGNVTSVTELMVDALPCKGCHDLYREPKK